MINFNLSDLALRANGQLVGSDLVITKVSTNSKDCKGALFVPLKGEKFDGHDFIADAIANGAQALVSQRSSEHYALPCIYCDDTLYGYGLCGQIVRDKCHAVVCSITGSCGKTTVKEMVASILTLKGKTLFTEANFNNDVGVPKTLLNLESDTKYAVIEQGASHLLDIKRTCAFVKSQVALINNVGIAHVEGFGSKFNVYKGKSEILDDVFLRNGIGIIPADSEYYDNWLHDYNKEYCDGRLISFGFSAKADVKVTDVVQKDKFLSFSLSYKDQSITLKLEVLGVHNALNAAAATAMALCLGLSLNDVMLGLSTYKGVGSRLHIVQNKPYTLIDDAYNASFNATLAAIDTLSTFNGYRVLIFADMKELGVESTSAHQKIGQYCTGKIDLLLAYGELSKLTVKSATIAAKHFNCQADLLKYVNDFVLAKENLIILVKGSHSMEPHKIVHALQVES